MRFGILILGLVTLAVLVAAGVVGAASTSVLRGHSAASASAATAAANPLDPLTADEIQRPFVTIKTAMNLAPATFLPLVKLSEPPKSFMLGWSPTGDSTPLVGGQLPDSLSGLRSSRLLEAHADGPEPPQRSSRGSPQSIW